MRKGNFSKTGKDMSADKIARFEKVSRKQWTEDFLKQFGSEALRDRYKEHCLSAAARKGADNAALENDEYVRLLQQADSIYDAITLPKRATSGSAGYDICTPIDISLKPGESIKIPTGIRASMREDYCLFIMPRSGLGSKYRFQLINTVGVIDSDYYCSDNEGHIFVPMINDSREDKTVELKAGSAFVQAIFCRFGITEDDETEGTRNGGFGSTG